jgi:hypothetical protein
MVELPVTKTCPRGAVTSIAYAYVGAVAGTARQKIAPADRHTGKRPCNSPLNPSIRSTDFAICCHSMWTVRLARHYLTTQSRAGWKQTGYDLGWATLHRSKARDEAMLISVRPPFLAIYFF